MRGQWADYQLPAPITFDHMNLSVFADGRHSVPTRIRLEVGGDVRELMLPPLADQAGENAVATVPLSFPAVTGSDVRVTIEDVRELQTFNYFSNGLSLSPVAVAELGIPGLEAPATPAALEWRVSPRPAAHRRPRGPRARRRVHAGRGRDGAPYGRAVRPG